MSNRSRGGSVIGSAPAAVPRIWPIRAIQRRRNRQRAKRTRRREPAGQQEIEQGRPADPVGIFLQLGPQRRSLLLMIEREQRRRGNLQRQQLQPAEQVDRFAPGSPRSSAGRPVRRPAGRRPAPRPGRHPASSAAPGPARRRGAAPASPRPSRAACLCRGPAPAAGASPRCAGNFRRSRSGRGGSLPGR